MAGAVLMDGQQSRHDFKLNPNVSAVCPASDTLAGDSDPNDNHKGGVFAQPPFGIGCHYFGRLT